MQEARMRQFGFSAYSRPAPVPTMPEGLVELMEGLGREVLRHNPTDVHQFCADHMKKLLDIRDAHEGRTAAKQLTLEKKIAKAQAKVRQRAEQRRKKYDELIKQVIQEDRQVEEKDEMAIEKPAIALVDRVTVLNQVVNAFSSPTCDENVNTSNVATEKQEDETIIQNILAITETTAEATSDSIEKEGEAEKIDNTGVDKEVYMEENEVDIKTIEVEAKDESAITEYASIEDSVPTKVMSSEENYIIAQPNENRLVDVFEAQNQIVVENKDEILQKIGDVKPVNEDTSSEHQSEGTIEIVVIEPQENETESNAETLEENRDDKSEDHMENHDDNKDEQITVVKENVELIPEPDYTANFNDSASTMDEKEYLKSQDDVSLITSDSVETLPNLKCSENVIKENEEVFDCKIAERETLDKSLKEISEEKEIYKLVEETSDEKAKKTQGNDDEDKIKPENLVIKNELDSSMDQIEIKIIELKKAPEVLDGKKVKDNEEVILKSSVYIDGDETVTVPVNISTDNGEEANDGNSQQNDVEESKNINSQVSTDRLDIDIDSIAKSDSTNDMITEESNDSSSDSKHTNGADDSLNKSPRSASTMDLETAAVTIQKVFRNFLFKSRASTLDDVSIDDGSMEAAYPPDDVLSDQGGNVPHVDEQYHAPNIKERRTLGITRMDTVLQTVNEEKSLSLSTDDSSLSSAATIIQAHVRGFLVRNKLHSHKTNSLVHSDGQPSFDIENEQQKNKTVLNIHIVPEGGHYMSRDESMAMSLDLPYDNSPTSSTNLHPFSFDTAERRKQLKREDAIQSISPPSNNSGKLSEDIDSVKDTIHDTAGTPNTAVVADDDVNKEQETPKDVVLTSGDTTPTKSITADTVIENLQEVKSEPPKPDDSHRSVTENTSDEADVVTAGVGSDGSPRGLRHSGECHDAPLPVPTSVTRADSTVAREFKNVLSYLLIWNSPS